MHETPKQFLFLDFILDCGTRRLLAGQTPIPLTPKEFATLVCLVVHAPHAVPRETIMRTVWPDTIVGDTSLARNISILRRHLGVAAIEAVPRFGYRFTPAVMVVETVSPQSAPSDQQPEAAPLQADASTPGPPRHRTGPALWLGVAAVLIVSLLIFFRLHQPRANRFGNEAAASQTATVRRLAVLPFRNLSAQPAATDYLRDGLVDDLTVRLGTIDYAHL